MTRQVTRRQQPPPHPTRAAARPIPGAGPRRRPRLVLTTAGVAVIALLTATVLLTRPAPAIRRGRLRDDRGIDGAWLRAVRSQLHVV